MNRNVRATLVFFCTPLAWCQTPAARDETVPIYRVTVVERTVDAINYQYRSGPSRLDFRGTVLLPEGKGEATVESKTGRTEIDAKFDRLTPPTPFGAEYLTYVLWAVSPEGRPSNLGEAIADGNGHARLHVTTDMQVFGLIVTAEPYGAVRLPSDVVVLENHVRPDTMGEVIAIRAKYGLMPRGHYTYNVPASLTVGAAGPKLPMDKYEAVLHVYEAQNALQIAHAMGADRYAPDTYDRAQTLLRQARQMQVGKTDPRRVVTVARQAAQTADDARILAERGKHEEEVTRARQQVAEQEQARREADAQAQRAQAEAAAAKAQSEAERVARERAEAEQAAQQQADRVAPITQPLPSAATSDADKIQLRIRLRADLSRETPALDTPRGLVATLPDADFSGAAPRPEVYQRLARIAAIMAAQPGLRIEVEGHTDGGSGADYSVERAEIVRSALVRGGVPADAVVARSLGRTRPLVSNATATGRSQNRRVEIVVTGDPIGAMAQWDRAYTLK